MKFKKGDLLFFITGMGEEIEIKEWVADRDFIDSERRGRKITFFYSYEEAYLFLLDKVTKLMPIDKEYVKSQAEMLRACGAHFLSYHAYTDYPIEELGDKIGEKAPIRPVTLIGYDGDKYVTCLILGTDLKIRIKAAYLYEEPGRCGEIHCVEEKYLKRLSFEEDYS